MMTGIKEAIAAVDAARAQVLEASIAMSIMSDNWLTQSEQEAAYEAEQTVSAQPSIWNR